MSDSYTKTKLTGLVVFVIAFVVEFLIDEFVSGHVFMLVAFGVPFLIISLLAGMISKKVFRYFALIYLLLTAGFFINNYFQESAAAEKIEKIQIVLNSYKEKNGKYPDSLEDVDIDPDLLFFRKGILQRKESFSYDNSEGDENPYIAYSIIFFKVKFFYIKTSEWKKPW